MLKAAGAFLKGSSKSAKEETEDDQLLEEAIGPWEPPNEEKAKYAFAKQHYHHELFSLRETRTGDLAEFGEGHALYFYFLKWMALLLGLLSLVSALPNIAANCLGNYSTQVEPGKGGFRTATLGNFGPMFTTGLENLTSAVPNSQLGARAIMEAWRSHPPEEDTATMSALFWGTVPKRSVSFWVSLLDVAGCALYFGASFAIVRQQNKVIREVKERTVTIGDYSVHVWGLPKDAREEEVRKYFETWGPLAACELARNDSELITLALQRGEIERRLDNARARARQAKAEGRPFSDAMEQAARWRAQLQEYSMELQRLQAQRGEAEVVCAFMTFKENEGRVRCMRALPNTAGRRYLQMRHNRFRKRFALQVVDAPEPSDVLWENLEFTTGQRVVRRGMTACITYLCLAVGFVLINMTTSVGVGLGSSSAASTTCADCGYLSQDGSTFGVTAEQKTLYTACANSPYNQPDGTPCSDTQKGCYKCFCSAVVKNVKFSERSYCAKYAGVFVLSVAAPGISVAITVAINTALTYLAAALTSYERHHTLSSEKRSLARKLFLAQFLNTAVTTLAANAALPPLQAALDGTPLKGLLFTGIYGDLIPAWYAKVGRGLLITILTTGVCRIGWLGYRVWCYRSQVKERHKCVTQAELQAALTGPEFDLAPRYGELFNIIFVALFFSSALPALLPLAAAICGVSYWAEKWELLRLSRVPPHYTGDLAELAGDLLPYAAIWHAGFAAWAFSFFATGASKLAKSPLDTVTEAVGKVVGMVLFGRAEGSAKQIGRRCLQSNAIHHTIACFAALLILGLKVMGGTGRSLLGQLGSLLGLGGDEVGDAAGLPPFAIAVRSRLLVGPASYAITANAKYAVAFARQAWEDEEPKRRRRRRKEKPQPELLPEEETDTAARAAVEVGNTFSEKDVESLRELSN